MRTAIAALGYLLFFFGLVLCCTIILLIPGLCIVSTGLLLTRAAPNPQTTR